MTVSISNLNFTWANSSNVFTAIGANVNASSYASGSRVLKLRVNGNTIFEVSNTAYKSFVYTVSGLPTAASVEMGARAFVSDANQNSFLANVYSGGSNAVPVFSDGTQWKIG